MLKVTMDVYDNYKWGKLAGKVNPKSAVSFTLFGKSVKEAAKKLMDGDGNVPIYKVTEVVNCSG